MLPYVMKFSPCRELFADILKLLSTPVNGASVHLSAFISASGSGRPAPAHVSLRPNCGPQKLKGIFVLTLLKVRNIALTLLVSHNYFNGTFVCMFALFYILKNVLKFSYPENCDQVCLFLCNFT